MADEIVDLGAAPEIFADEVASAYLSGGVVRMCFWSWQTPPTGMPYKALSGRLLITRPGLVASRPLVSRVLGLPEPNLMIFDGMERAAH